MTKQSNKHETLKNWLIMGTKYERYHISFKAFKQLFVS